jgi:hypothetical protein
MGLPSHLPPALKPHRHPKSEIVRDLAYIPGWREEARWWLLGTNVSGDLKSEHTKNISHTLLRIRVHPLREVEKSRRGE